MQIFKSQTISGLYWYIKEGQKIKIIERGGKFVAVPFKKYHVTPSGKKWFVLIEYILTPDEIRELTILRNKYNGFKQ